MEVVESMFMKVTMNGNSHIVTYAEDCTKCICTQTHMSILSHIFKALALLLHRIIARTQTVNFDLFRLNLYALPCSLAFNKRTSSPDTCPCGNSFQLFNIHYFRANYHLYVLNG